MTSQSTATVPAAVPPIRWRAIALGSGLSAVILLLALLTWHQLFKTQSPGQAFPLASMAVERGQAERTADGWRIAGTDGGTVLLAMNFGNPADMTAIGRMRLETDRPLRDVALLWMTADAPGRVREAPFDETGHIDLDQAPDWNGRPLALGLRVQGEDPVGATIGALALLPPDHGLAGFLADLAGQLQTRTEIGHQSINTWIVDEPGAPSLQVLLALAVLATLAGFGLTRTIHARTPVLLPTVLVLAVAWLALDYRWQRTLLDAHADSIDRYAGIPPSQLRQAGPQGELVPWVENIAQTLDPAARVLVFSKEEFSRLKTRYLLSPLNAIGAIDPADAARHLRTGDQIVIIGPHPGIRISGDGRRMLLADPTGQARQFDVEPLHADRQGGAFRVTGPAH
ncbi:MAG: hypothetical protein ACLFSG_03830 [Halothiobacillaceae bacterium]